MFAYMYTLETPMINLFLIDIHTYPDTQCIILGISSILSRHCSAHVPIQTMTSWNWKHQNLFWAWIDSMEMLLTNHNPGYRDGSMLTIESSIDVFSLTRSSLVHAIVWFYSQIWGFGSGGVDFVFWILDFGVWILFVFWSLDFGVWSFEFGILDLGTVVVAVVVVAVGPQQCGAVLLALGVLRARTPPRGVEGETRGWSSSMWPSVALSGAAFPFFTIFHWLRIKTKLIFGFGISGPNRVAEFC